MILVTGGMGFIGLHTARELLGSGADLVLTRYHDVPIDGYGRLLREALGA